MPTYKKLSDVLREMRGEVITPISQETADALATLIKSTTLCNAKTIFNPNSYNYADAVDRSGPTPDRLPPKDTFNTESPLDIKIKKHKVKFNFKL